MSVEKWLSELVVYAEHLKKLGLSSDKMIEFLKLNDLQKMAFAIRQNKKDGGMSILKTFFLKFKSAAKTLKKYLTSHINLTEFAIFPEFAIFSLC